MLYLDDIKVEFDCQGYKATHFGISPDKTQSVLFFENTVETKDVIPIVSKCWLFAAFSPFPLHLLYHI